MLVMRRVQINVDNEEQVFMEPFLLNPEEEQIDFNLEEGDEKA